MESVIKLKAVILDMDGVMLDTEPIYRMAWQRAANELSFHMSDDLYSSFMGKNNEDGEKELFEIFGPKFSIKKFRVLWRKYWEEYIEANGIQKKTGLNKFLDFLRERKLYFYIATSNNRKDVTKCLRLADLDHLLNFVVTGDDVSRGKPAPDIFQEAAKRLTVLPQYCIAIEDSNAGVYAASAAGMSVMIIPDIQPISENSIGLCSGIVSSLAEAQKIIEDILYQTDNKNINSNKVEYHS